MVTKSTLNQRLDGQLFFNVNMLTLHERQNYIGHITLNFYHKPTLNQRLVIQQNFNLKR